MFGSPEIIECCTQESQLNDSSIHRVEIVNAGGDSWYRFNIGRIYIVEYIGGMGFKVLQSDHFFHPQDCKIIETIKG